MLTKTHLISNGAVIDDTWVLLDDETPLGDTPAIISLDRLKAEADALRLRNAKLGEDVRELTPYLDMLSTIAIDFPVYRNGRGYSDARILREEMGFEGELRAIGEVLFDQWSFMARCGFNTFEIDASIPVESFKEALNELSEAYQPAVDNQRGVLWRRHGL
jgi:uncharacterized protein (DUF934 family)